MLSKMFPCAVTKMLTVGATKVVSVRGRKTLSLYHLKCRVVSSVRAVAQRHNVWKVCRFIYEILLKLRFSKYP